MMQRCRLALLPVLVMAAMLPVAALAQAQTPEQVAERYFATMKASDWAGNVALMHPDALRGFRDVFVQVAQKDTTNALARQVFAVNTSAELTALSAAEVYQRFLANALSQQPAMREVLNGATMKAVGHVDEGDTTHVLYRMTMSMSGVPLQKLDVLSLRRDASGAWRVLLTGDVQNMLAGVQAATTARPAPPRPAPAGPVRPPAAPAPTRP